KAFECNEGHVRLAHSLLQPSDDGSVHLKRLRVDRGKIKGKEGQKWSHDDFVRKISRLKEVETELRAVNDELRTVKIFTARIEAILQSELAIAPARLAKRTMDKFANENRTSNAVPRDKVRHLEPKD